MNTFIEVLGVTDALVFILYILIIISIGFFASRKVKNAKDFSTAGQSLTPLVLILSRHLFWRIFWVWRHGDGWDVRPDSYHHPV